MNFSINTCWVNIWSRLHGDKLQCIILARKMTYPQSDNAGNAKTSGKKKSKNALGRLKLVGMASPGGVSYGWGLTVRLITQSWLWQTLLRTASVWWWYKLDLFFSINFISDLKCSKDKAWLIAGTQGPFLHLEFWVLVSELANGDKHPPNSMFWEGEMR